jgi:hypothetical protein
MRDNLAYICLVPDIFASCRDEAEAAEERSSFLQSMRDTLDLPALKCPGPTFKGAHSESEEHPTDLDDSFDGSYEESPYMHVNLVIPEDEISDEISELGVEMLLGMADWPASDRKKLLEEADVIQRMHGASQCADGSDEPELVGFDELNGNRLAWIAVELPAEDPSMCWYRGDAGCAACGGKGAFYTAVNVAPRTEALFGYLRSKVLGLKPLPELVEQKSVMKSGGFHVCVGALYPPFMDYIDVIAKEVQESMKFHDPSRPIELVLRGREMRRADTALLLTAYKETLISWLTQYADHVVARAPDRCDTYADREDQTEDEPVENLRKGMPTPWDVAWRCNKVTPGNCDGDCQKCNPCVYFKSGCGRGKIQLPLDHRARYVAFFVEKSEGVLQISGYLQPDTMVIVAKEENKQDRVLGTSPYAGLLKIDIKWDLEQTPEDRRKTYRCMKCWLNGRQDHDCSAEFPLDCPTTGYVLANCVARSCELCHQHPDLRARRGQKKRPEDEDDKPLLRARDKRAQKLEVLTEQWVQEGLPSFILALLRNPPAKDDEPKDEAWKMLGKLNKIFQVKDPKEADKKKKQTNEAK